SIGRYITIRKPFNNQVSSVPLLLCFPILIPIIFTMKTIDVTSDRWDCRISNDSAWNRLTGLLVGAYFILLVMLISANYAEIVRHVHRKFSRRKARQPRYVREMTSSIVRVAVFHMICWLPFCFITCSLVLVSIRTISRINEHTWVLWILILANWLTYLNSALNWIFYVVLNRDLRELIRFSNTKRRKRSAMANYYSSSNLANRYSRQRLDRSLSIHALAESL
ncbi:unnamed protein product, partial [Brugia pahangi]|uniref:G_PROTEIN_RECEP_F1_2 domain-containing protein n=1 Tax=Brugia pahangi TaxID=6280 RepID=A0A0N4T7L1_BRUPA